MRIIVGLGNPGPKYVDTRHNFGFLLLDELAEILKNRPGYRKTGESELAQIGHWQKWESADNRPFILLWPLTYMNLSGRAVSYLISKTDPETFSSKSDLVVVIDDLSLGLGQVRLRTKGSSGGHNGLKSVEAMLGHRDYPRFRLGIGAPPADGDIIDYVLDSFPKAERRLVEEVIHHGARFLVDWLDGVSFDILMGKVNGWKSNLVEPIESEV